MSDDVGAGAWVELDVEEVVDSRVLAGVRYGGERVGRVVYSNFEQMLVVYELTLDAPHAEGPAEAAVLHLLTQRFRDGNPPQTYYHVGITHPRTLLRYKESALHRGAVLTGALGERIYYHDRLVHIDADTLRAASAEGGGSTGMVLTWAAEIEELDRLSTITAADIHRLLHATTASARIGALRELATQPQFPTEERDRAYMYALLDNSYEVRRFASVGMTGFFPGVVYHPSLPVILDHLAEPMRSIADLDGALPTMPEGWVYDPAHGSRNKRYGLLWVLGAMCSMGPPLPPAQAWRHTWLPKLTRLLRGQAMRHTPQRDEELLRLAHHSLLAEGDRHGIGREPGLNLFDLLRYAVLRYHLIARSPDPDADRFYWLMEMVDAIVISPISPRNPWKGRERRKFARKLMALPDAPLPEIGELPPFLLGRWYDEASELVPPA